MMYNRCDSCCGKKTILGLGGIVKDCSKCNGVGYVKVEEPKKKKKGE